MIWSDGKWRFTLLIVLAVAGCGPVYDGPPLTKVTGVVTLDGEPLSGADILLIPQGTTLGQGGAGRTDASGRFSLKSPDGKFEGVVQGGYRVVINKLVTPDGADFVPTPDMDPMTAAYREILPAIYSDSVHTTLTAQIGPGTPPLEFKLVSQPH